MEETPITTNNTTQAPPAPPPTTDFKTYIWNTEYKVYAAMALTEDRARYSIKTEWMDQKSKSILTITTEDPKLKKSIIQSFLWEGDEFYITIAKPADHILEPGKALIYDHSNE